MHFSFLQVSLLFSFFVPTGLGDRNEEVRAEMLSAALAAVNHLGKVKKYSVFLTCLLLQRRVYELDKCGK